MKKFAFFTLLCICLSAIAVTSGNSRPNESLAYSYVTNIADTAPKKHHTTTHHTTTKPSAKDTTMHKTATKKTTPPKNQ